MSRVVSYEKLIIVFPIYAGDVPDVLREFFNTLEGNNVQTVLIASWGNVHTSNALYNAKELLEVRGFKVVGGAELVAPHTYNNEVVKLGNNRPTEEEMNELKNFLEEVFNKLSGEVVFPKERRTIMMLFPQPSIPRKMIRMDLKEESCNNCKRCQKKCPVNAIADDMKINHKKCIRCLACVKVCKPQARTTRFLISLGENHLLKYQDSYKESRFY